MGLLQISEIFSLICTVLLIFVIFIFIAIPCVISLLVAALYNIVDQIFIANTSYLGSYGNAANTIVFPLTVVALAIAMMI